MCPTRCALRLGPDRGLFSQSPTRSPNVTNDLFFLLPISLEMMEKLLLSSLHSSRRRPRLFAVDSHRVVPRSTVLMGSFSYIGQQGKVNECHGLIYYESSRRLCEQEKSPMWRHTPHSPPSSFLVRFRPFSQSFLFVVFWTLLLPLPRQAGAAAASLPSEQDNGGQVDRALFAILAGEW